MKTNSNAAVAVLLLLSVLPSCRSVAKLVGDRDADPRGNIRWANSFEEIDGMPDETKRTLYLAPIRNVSASDMDVDLLAEAVREGARKRGWTLTRGPKEACYQLSVTLQYWGENPNPDAGDWALRHAREALAVAGAVGGAATADNGWDLVLRGAAGGVAGVVVGTAVKNRSRASEWNLVLETRLEERVDGAVTQSVAADRAVSSGTGTTADAADGGAYASSTAATTTTKQQFQSIKDRFRHRNVLVGYARQIRMSEAEALAYLTPKLERALPGILP